MVFSSTAFLFAFLPAVLLLVYPLARAPQNAALLAGSVGFYVWGAGTGLWAIALVALVSWAGALALGRLSPRWAGVAFALVVLAVVAPLVMLKYWPVVRGAGSPTAADVAVPLGISFFTFHALSYLADVRRGALWPDARADHYLVYLFLFPHQIAGPIVRYSELVPDKSVSAAERLGPWGRDAVAQCSGPLRRVLEDVAAERSSLSLIAPETIARWGEGPSWTPGDTHWTPLASRALLDAVLTRRGVAPDEARRIVASAARPRGVQFPNDLYLLMELLDAGRRDPVASIVGAADTAVENLKPSPFGRPHRRWITGRPARTAEREVVVIGDSFAEQPFPAIAATWGCGTAATWDATTWESLPATADLVVLQGVERGMRRRVAQLTRPESAPFWEWLSTRASAGPSRTCPASGGS